MIQSNRTALARTWRPRLFSEMATQEHVSDTLRAAVARGRTAHAYLFCGPRGVGKTTAARVLAMALNCPARTPEGEPCGECDSCAKIWAGKTSLDVVEIDAASNRGVDDARDLRERAMYAPTQEDRYKVYIIDEAHMLTREAWNALLKILEEPPPRVIFVFATTEPQKIQQTAAPILSRCQRFDFRRITTQGIVDRLRIVLAGEGVEADDDALLPIARRAEGGMRDALSLMDQVLSFADGRVTGDDVRRVLGLVDDELYLEMFDILAARDYAGVFRFVQRVIDDGYDLAEFYRGLADALRTLMIAKLEGTDAAEVRDDLKQEYADVAERFATGDLLRMLSMVAELDTEGKFRKSANPRTMLEALLLRWAFLEQTVDLETLLRAAGGEAAAPLAERPAPRPPPAAPATPEQPAPTIASSGDLRQDAERALRSMLEQKRAPHGLGMFLRAARVADATESGITLELPGGPGLEQLSGESQPRRTVQAILSELLGRRVVLSVRAADVDAAPAARDSGEPWPEDTTDYGGSQTSPGEAPPQGAGGAQRGRQRTPPQRITPERVKAERLATLCRDDEVLKSAVAEWDLELLD